MKLATVFLILVLGLWSGVGLAGEQKQIELGDGSVVSGEIMSLRDGIYTIQSKSLGTLKIPASEIRAIDHHVGVKGSEDASDTPASDSGSDLQAVILMMMKDKEVMEMIQSLQQDPEFQKILEDPAVMNAVKRGDTSALMRNPKFMKLLSHPKVQEIRDKIED